MKLGIKIYFFGEIKKDKIEKWLDANFEFGELKVMLTEVINRL